MDTYYLSSFAEYTRVHGLTICALFDTPANDNQIEMWHWENSASVRLDALIGAIQEQGSKLWRLHLNRDHQHNFQALYEAARSAHGMLAARPTVLSAEALQRLEEMAAEDQPPPVDEAERAILFHAPYHRLSEGNFRTFWLVRSFANRLMHVRGALEELFMWIGTFEGLHPALALATCAHEAFTNWKTLNIICARCEIASSKQIPQALFQQLRAGIDADERLGLACRQSASSACS